MYKAKDSSIQSVTYPVTHKGVNSLQAVFMGEFWSHLAEYTM